MNKYKFAFGKGKGKTIAEFFGVQEYSDNIKLQNDLIRIERGQELSPTRMRYYNG